MYDLVGMTGHLEIFDALIIGGGHAGLSAALTLYRQNHTCLILDGNQPRNKWKTPLRALPGWEHNDPEKLRETSRRELAQTGLVTIVTRTAHTIEREENGGFRVLDNEDGVWKGRKLLITTGKQDVYPQVPGYQENYPDRIFPCMFTFGYEYLGSNSAGLLAREALSSPHHAAMVVHDAMKFAKGVNVYADGNMQLAEELQVALQETGATVDTRKVRSLRKGERGAQMTIEFENGETVQEDFLVHQPASVVNHDLIDQLGLELDARGDIVTKPPFFHTEVPGVFAAGDCASPFKMVANAQFQGSNAGAGMSRELPTRSLESVLAN